MSDEEYIFDQRSTEPLYRQLITKLKKDFDNGVYGPDGQLPPEVDMADRLRVSRGTVRKALDTLVNEGRLVRRRGLGTFITIPEATGGASRLVGVVVPYNRDDFTGEIIRSIEGALREAGISLVLAYSNGDPELEAARVGELMASGISGLILVPVAHQREMELLYPHLKSDFPVVTVDRRLPGFRSCHIASDNVGGGEIATAHLIESEFTRIACITTDNPASSIADRIRGYQQAMQRKGFFPLSPVALQLPTAGPDTEYHGMTNRDQELLSRLIEGDTRVNGLFCINDIVALSILTFVRSRFPDVAVIGFDNTRVSAFPSVSLSSVEQPKSAIGEAAAQAMIRRLASPTAEILEEFLPTSLVVRDSSHPARVAHNNLGEGSAKALSSAGATVVAQTVQEHGEA